MRDLRLLLWISHAFWDVIPSHLVKSSQSLDRNLNVQNYSPNDTAYIPDDMNPLIFTFWSLKTFGGLTFLNMSSQHFQLKLGVIIVSRIHVALVVCLFALTPLGWLCSIMLTPYLFHYFSWEYCWLTLTFAGTQLGHKRRTWCTDYY